MVNRYDEPASYGYISQYVPIPFEKLYALGKDYADQRKQAEKELETNIKKFGEFVSPSSVDTQNYYNASIKVLDPLIQEAAVNPSVMKNADYRARLQNTINNLDYNLLSQYQQSAENLRLREQNIAKLQAEGRYDINMDDVDITNWNTKDQGIMNNLNPIRYQSIREQVEPYVNNLQDSFLYSKGGYNWIGVDADTVIKQVDTNWSSIRNTPIAEAHIKAMMKNGMTLEQAENAFRNQAMNDALEYVRKQPVVDPYAMAEYQNRAAIRSAQAGKGSQGEPSGAVLGLSDMLTGQYLKHRQNIFNRTLSNDSRDELSDPSFLQKYQKLTEESQINIDNLTNQIMNSNPKFAQAVELIKQTLIAKGHQDSEELDQVAFQAALQSPVVSNKDRNKINSAIQQYEEQHQNMIKEAEGRAMQKAFNKTLQLDPNANPFSNFRMYVDGGEYMYDEKKVHDMWEDGLRIITQPVGPNLNQNMLNSLFGSNKKVNEEVGYIIDPNKLISPRSIVLDNPYVTSLVEQAGHKINDVKNMHLDRDTWGQDNFDIEERIAKGDFGKVAIDKVEGYIEQGNTKGLLVSVNVPYKDIENAYTSWWRIENPKNTLKDYGFTVSGAPEGAGEDSRWSQGYVTVRMVLGTSDSDVDKIMTNRSYQKEAGTTNTKEMQIQQDDALMNQINNWTPGMGF